MKCIICDLNSVDRGCHDKDEDLDSHRALLLSIFCKYFNWENNCNLTSSQILSWISFSSSSPTSNFPFCLKCEEKMNELNELHDRLAKIQLSISTLISSMSMEIIKVVETSFISSSSPSKCKSVAKSKTPDVKSVGEFRKTVYAKFKPNVIVKDCETPKQVDRRKTTTTSTQSSNKRKRGRPSKLKTQQAPSRRQEREDNEGKNTIFMKYEPDSPSPAFSPDHDDTFDDEVDAGISPIKKHKIADSDQEDEIAEKLTNKKEAKRLIKKDATKEKRVGSNRELRRNKKSPPGKSSLVQYATSSRETSEDEDFEPPPKSKKKKRKKESQDKKLFNINPVVETEPGSGIFRYVNWEFSKLSDKTYKCHTCQETREGGKQSMLRHINRHHNDVRPRCEACGKSWATQEQKDGHHCKPLIIRPKVVQELSAGQFLYMNKYLYQKVDKDSNDLRFEFMCLNDNCGKLTRAEQYMQKHIREHHDDADTTFICDLCGKVLGTASCLKKHKDVSHSAKSHACEVCGKTFTTKTYLRNHSFSHKGPFTCGFQGCGKQYTAPRGLKLHQIMADHCEVDTGKYDTKECPNCMKKFVGEERLTKHLTSLVCVIQKLRCHLCAKEIKRLHLPRHLTKFCSQNPEYPDRMRKASEKRKQSQGEQMGGEVAKGKEEEEQQQPSSQPGIEEQGSV